MWTSSQEVQADGAGGHSSNSVREATHRNLDLALQDSPRCEPGLEGAGRLRADARTNKRSVTAAGQTCKSHM